MAKGKAGIRDLRKIEIGFQGLGTGAVCDTPATPGARMVGRCGMKKIVNRVFPTEPTGLMSDHIINRSYDPWIMAEIPIEPGDEGATFEQLPWLLLMGIAGGEAASPWNFCPDLINGDMPQVATLRYGDNATVWESSCCFARQLVISGAFQGAWNITADVIGRDAEIVGGGFEGLPYPTDAPSFGPLETILGQMTKFYLGDDCNVFTTPAPALKMGSLIDWTVTIPGFHPKFFQDGELYYTAIGLASRHLTLEATIEWDDTFAAAEHAAWILGTPRYVRIEAEGATPASATVTIDMVLMYESFETLDQRDGNDTIKFTARTVYDVECVTHPCYATGFEWGITVLNTQTALP